MHKDKFKMYLPNARISQTAVTHLPLNSFSTAKLEKKDYKETKLSTTYSKFLSLQAMLKNMCRSLIFFFFFAARALYLARTCYKQPLNLLPLLRRRHKTEALPGQTPSRLICFYIDRSLFFISYLIASFLDRILSYSRTKLFKRLFFIW